MIRQKSYANWWHRPIEFHVGDEVFLRLSPARRLIRFWKKGELSSRFFGPYEILDRIREADYI